MASRISRKVCSLGRPGALGAGRWGSMQDHSSSERSVGFHFLMRARVAKYPPRTTFHTVSERLSEKSWKHPSVALQTTVKALLDPFRPPHKVRIRLRSPPRTPFRTVSPRTSVKKR